MILRHLYFDIVSDFDIRISDLRKAPSTSVERALQIHSILQNKPNLSEVEINAKHLFTKNYQKNTAFRWGENKANSNPIKPKNNQKSKINYEDKANSKPIKFLHHLSYAGT